VDKRQTPGDIGPIERHGEKEPQRRDRRVDRRRPDVRFAQVQLEQTEVFGGGRLRRSTEEVRESLDCADVIALRLRGQTPDGHVLDHAAAKRGDALLCHGLLLSEAGLPTP
jgi:hypothetical protein